MTPIYKERGGLFALNLHHPTLEDATRCRDCGHPVDGRWTRYLQGRDPEGFWVLCDACNPIGGAA